MLHIRAETRSCGPALGSVRNIQLDITLCSAFGWLTPPIATSCAVDCGWTANRSTTQQASDHRTHVTIRPGGCSRPAVTVLCRSRETSRETILQWSLRGPRWGLSSFLWVICTHESVRARLDTVIGLALSKSFRGRGSSQRHLSEFHADTTQRVDRKVVSMRWISIRIRSPRETQEWILSFEPAFGRLYALRL